MGTEVRACRKCRTLFNSLWGKQICPKCEEKEEENLTKVKDYLWTHKDAPMATVVKECEVTQAEIKTWLRQERIQLAEGSLIEITCESCGSKIFSGRFCDKCKSQTHSQLTTVINEANTARRTEEKRLNEKESPRMRFLKN